jgi:hypothetical protein
VASFIHLDVSRLNVRRECLNLWGLLETHHIIEGNSEVGTPSLEDRNVFDHVKFLRQAAAEVARALSSGIHCPNRFFVSEALSIGIPGLPSDVILLSLIFPGQAVDRDVEDLSSEPRRMRREVVRAGRGRPRRGVELGERIGVEPAE